MTLDITLSFADAAPDEAELRDVWTEYFTQIQQHFIALAAPSFAVEDVVQDALNRIDMYTPPNGAIVFARDSSGYILGCGCLRMLDDDRVELKRLFVRDIARGMGLGRKLIAKRIEKARDMGAKLALADTVRGNTSMLAIYDSFGFTPIPRYDGNGNPEDLDDYLVYRQLEL